MFLLNLISEAFSVYFPTNHGDLSMRVLNPLKNTLFACCALIAILIISIEQTIGQGKFTYTPVNPKAGDEIEITYTLPDSIFYYPEAYVVKYIDKREYLFDLKLIKNGNHYSSKIKTDSNNNLLIFSFRNGGKWDNNSNNGNLIFIKANENQKIYSHLNAANFFNFYGPYRLGLNKNNKAALENYDIQFKKYPSTKNKYLLAYLNFLKTIDPIKTKLMVDSMINVQLINGLKTKDDFENIQELYGIIGDQSNIEKYKIIRLEKIALNIYDEKDLNQILLKENDIVKKEQILNEISKNKKTKMCVVYLYFLFFFFLTMHRLSMYSGYPM